MESISLTEIYYGNLYASRYEEFYPFMGKEFVEGWLTYDPDEKDITKCHFEVIVDGIVTKSFNPFIDKSISNNFGIPNSDNLDINIVKILASKFPLHCLSKEIIDWWRSIDIFSESFKSASAEITVEIDNQIVESIMEEAKK